ncbi:MAG TPA: 4Fe-4S dicluster domain-containing protein [Nitrosopumilaceae archaeon]|nr:4Fe-4S dicluster domain-containing protein [Nitrosopumilaceae archaeon]
MSLLLKDRVYTMEAPTAKRGVYPLHGYKLGLYRLPIKLDEPLEIQSVHDGMKNTFAMDTYADRIYATYSWKEENMPDPDAKGYEQVELSITVEIVTGEVVDIIYQIFPIEKFGDPQWVKDYRKKADYFAKMIIDTILRNTILADKMVESLVKSEKISEDDALKKLEQMTPLAKIVPDAKPIPIKKEEQPETTAKVGQQWKGGGIKPGPIDVEYKSKMGQSAPYKTPGNYAIKTWGRVGADNGIMGVWGEFVSVDYDICIADGGCIDACPVNVYEWFDTPGNPASEKKPLMAREPDCIFCLACEGVCPPQAIKIFENK